MAYKDTSFWKHPSGLTLPPCTTMWHQLCFSRKEGRGWSWSTNTAWQFLSYYYFTLCPYFKRECMQKHLTLIVNREKKTANNTSLANSCWSWQCQPFLQILSCRRCERKLVTAPTILLWRLHPQWCRVLVLVCKVEQHSRYPRSMFQKCQSHRPLEWSSQFLQGHLSQCPEIFLCQISCNSLSFFSASPSKIDAISLFRGVKAVSVQADVLMYNLARNFSLEFNLSQ